MNAKNIQLAVIITVAVAAIIEGRSIIVENTEVFGSEFAGLYIVALGILMVILGILSYLSKEETTDENSEQDETKENNKRVGQLFPLLVVYGFGIKFLGYILSTILFFIIFLRFFGRYKWRKVLVLAFGISISFGLLFQQTGMELPKGLLSFL